MTARGAGTGGATRDRLRDAAVAIGMLTAMAACGRPGTDAGATGPAAGSTAAPAAAPAAGGAAPGSAEPAAPALPPAASPSRAVPLVGGCKDDCRDAATAAARFLEATARADAPDAAAPFLDSTRLVLDGRDLGARWAELWRDLKSATRRAEMGEALRDLSGWTTGLSAAQVKDAVTAGPVAVRIWSTEAEFEFRPPGSPTWTIRLAPRGIEWLIVEVRRGSNAAPAGKESP